MFTSTLDASIRRGSRVLLRRLSTTSTSLQQQPRVVLLGSLVRPTPTPRSSGLAVRAFSNADGSSKQQKQQSKQSSDDSKKKASDDEETSELVLTPGQQVVMAGRLTMWAGIAAFAAVCAYYIIRELMPT